MSPSEQAETINQTAATGVGALLKASRLRIGEDLRDIADNLKIRYVYLEAIEDGRFGDLPGATYSLGFIRTYADHLGLDSDEVIRRFKNQFSEDASESDLVFPEPIPEMGIPGGAIVFIGILVAVAAYGIWYVNTSKDGFIAELISPVPERLARQDAQDKAAESRPPADAAAPEAAGGEAASPPVSAESSPAEPAPVETAPAMTAPEETSSSEAAPAETASPAAAPGETAASALAEKDVPDSAQIEAIVAEVIRDLASDAEPAPTPAAETPPPEPAPAPAPESAAAEPAPAPAPEPAPAETSRETAQEAASPPASESQAAAAPPEPVSGPSAVPMDIIPPPAATPATPATPAAETAALTPAPAEATPSPGEAKKKGRIVVRAKMNSWIQVRDDTVNELLFTRMLRVGDSYAVPARPGLKLSTGNAGALEILVDGEPVPSIGGEGAVRRNVFLDAERLKAGTAVGK